MTDTLKTINALPDLLPCPLCRSSMIGSDNCGTLNRIFCYDCGLQLDAAFEADGTSRWNRRAASVPRWTRVEDGLPKLDMLIGVLAKYRNELGKLRIVRACYIPRFTVEDHGDDGEFNEADDVHYFQEGWYELCETTPHDLIYQVGGTVTEWMPICYTEDTDEQR